ncbi:MAG TPA: HAMP domain-containing sensor histidine kinase [Polyangiaceae bacterium]|nr:HAMP domain-containing sensor histidine kinase [Polyangiaceae bacterium]
MKVEFRISLGITGVVAVALATALTLIQVLLNRFQEHQLDQALVELAHQEARAAPLHNFALTTHPGPAANDVGPLDKYGIIYGAGDKVIAATEPFDAAPPSPDELFKERVGVPFDMHYRGRSLRAVLVPLATRERATLLLATSRSDLDGDDEFLELAMLLAFFASIGCVLISALWLTRRFTREHRRIATTLHSVARGDLYARAPMGHADPDLEQWANDLNGVAERLGVLIRSQQRFIANASHELRSPLAALYGELQQSLRRERSAEDYKASITQALYATRRLKHLADDLLTLARAEHTRQEFEPVPLARVFDEVARELARQISEKSIRLEAELADLSVRGRPGDVQRLLRNLVDNAIRHSPAGGAVRCSARAEGERTVLLVSDEGPGVPEVDRERIFEPFFRSPETRSTAQDSAGLGLSIAREIARAHGGDLRVEDSPRGAVFSVELCSSSADATRDSPKGAAASAG